MILFNRRAKLEMAKVCADRLLGKKPFDISSINEYDHLVSGELRYQCHITGPYSSRCHNCSTKNPDGKFVWISDGTQMGEPLAALIATQKSKMWNGSASAWCISCALELIEKAGGQTPVIEKKPIPPTPQPPTAEEIEREKKFIEERMNEETRKHELAHALTNRVLTADEIREVAGHGINIYVHMQYRGWGGGSGSYDESVLQQRLSTAWQIQTNLRMAEGK